MNAIIIQYESILKYLYISLLLMCCATHIQAQSNNLSKETETYHNPVIGGDFADPSIIRIGDTYYAAGTSSEWAPHYPLFQSKDLINWEQLGYVFAQKSDWMLSSFWAPELFYHNNTFYVYYTVKRKKDGKSCIGVATSSDLTKGFTDHGVVVEHGSEAIDAFVWDDNGQLYISWKAYGLDKRPIEILAGKLSADGLKLDGKPFTLLKEKPDEKGIEGQYLLKRNGYYYLFYSAGGCCGQSCSYNVRIARSNTIEGPFVRHVYNPLLNKGDQWMCPGHGTLVQTEDNRYFYIYHAYHINDHVYTGRQAMLDELLWDEISGWPYFRYAENPTVEAEVPFPGTTQLLTDKLHDDFEASLLSPVWQWNFRSYEPVMKLEKGDLYLAGKTSAANKAGTALTVRPVKANYELITEVATQNESSKGLILYGDSSQAVGISIRNNRVEVWEVKNNRKKVLTNEFLNKSAPVSLRMAIEKGYLCRFYWSTDGKAWKEMQLQEGKQGFYNGSYLPQWDRSARAGLVHQGNENSPAVFSFFTIQYK